MPPAFAGSPFSDDAAERTWHVTGALINVPAMLVIAGVSALLIVGVHETARANSVIVAIKLVIILVFIVAAAPFVSLGTLDNRQQPRRRFHPPEYWPRPIRFERRSPRRRCCLLRLHRLRRCFNRVQEAKNPKRDMPIGILGSLVICTILYVAVGFVLTGIVPDDELNVPDPIAVGIDAIGLAALSPIFRQAWHHSRTDLGHSSHAARATAHLLFDGA